MATAGSFEGCFERLSLKDQDTKIDDELECHFKWKPDLGGNKTKILEFEMKLLRDLDENPSVRVQTYSLLGYILTLDSDTYDPDKSKEYFEKAVEEGGDVEDKRFVAEANLLVHRKESGKYRGLDKERKRLQEKWLRWEKEEPQKLAFTHGCHALALSKFGPNKVDAAIEQYGIAMELESENWNWAFGKALLLERKRALKTRDTKPSDETLELFEKAMELSDSDEHVLAFYANCLTALYQLTYVVPFRNSERGRGRRQQRRPFGGARRRLFSHQTRSSSSVRGQVDTRHSSRRDTMNQRQGLNYTGFDQTQDYSFGMTRGQGNTRYTRTGDRSRRGGRGTRTASYRGTGRGLSMQMDRSQTLHDINYEYDEKQQLEQKIANVLQEAKEKAVRKKSITVLKRCCKGYKDMKWFRDLKNCYEVAAPVAPENDSGFLHQVGQFFLKSPEKDFFKAKGFLERSANCSPSGNLFAALDYIKVRLLLKENVNVDREYGKLLSKYKPVVHNVAIIHENWARSLEKSEPDRVLDQVSHLEEAIKHFDPKVVQKYASWSWLESICREVVLNPNYEGDIPRDQACRDLGWMYFQPEPRTSDNLRNAKKYLSYLKQEEFEQDDIELYGKVLCELDKYEEALQQFEKLENSHQNKNFHQAKCLFLLGKEKSNNPEMITDAIDLLLKSIQNGCLDACQQLLHLVVGRDRDRQYRYSGYVNICLENTQNFALKENLEIESKFIKSKMDDILGIYIVSGLQGYEELKASFLEIRKLLLAMCTNYIKLENSSPTTNKDLITVVLENAKDVLTKARSALDHLHNQLQVKMCPGSTAKVYFPLITDKQRPKNKSPGSTEAIEWTLENIAKRFKNDLGDKDGSKGVADKCKDLIGFIAFHQPYTDPERYEWLYDAWDVVNVIKHQTNITELEWCTPGKEEKVNLVELAQKLAFYAEDMLQEYCKLF